MIRNSKSQQRSETRPEFEEDEGRAREARHGEEEQTHRCSEGLLLVSDEVFETGDDSLILDGSNGDVGSDARQERIGREPFPVPSSKGRSTERTACHWT